MSIHELLDEQRVLDANADLLDRQVVDLDGLPICKVDDLVVDLQSDGHWRVAAIVLGPGALGPRIGGRLGHTLTGIHRRMSGQSHPQPPSIPWSDVQTVGAQIRLGLTRSALPAGLTPLEDWLREHIIDRIPGSRHASG